MGEGVFYVLSAPKLKLVKRWRLAKTMGERVFYVLFAPKLKLVNF
jgi:hypothetical protein